MCGLNYLKFELIIVGKTNRLIIDGNPREIDFGLSKRNVRISEGSGIGS